MKEVWSMLKAKSSGETRGQAALGPHGPERSPSSIGFLQGKGGAAAVSARRVTARLAFQVGPSGRRRAET